MNSEECLKNAQECTEQAARAESPNAQAELLKVAMQWIVLAEEIDRLERLYPPRPCAAN